MKKALAIALLLGSASALRSHDPITTQLTWTREISRLVAKRCSSCHSAGRAAFPLSSYAQARPWAKAIRDQVLTRAMPPWGAVQGIGDFLDDPSLSQPEIEMLVAWVEGGAPEGDPAFLPHTALLQVSAMARAAVAPPDAIATPVAHSWKVSRATKLLAIRPQDLNDGQSLEAWATLPDRSVERLIWLRHYQNKWTRDYVLREPFLLPAGSTLTVRTASGAKAVFYFRYV